MTSRHPYWLNRALELQGHVDAAILEACRPIYDNNAYISLRLLYYREAIHKAYQISKLLDLLGMSVHDFHMYQALKQ
jgi:hypothetical protein